MNDTTPVGRITSMLTEAGYLLISTPLVIGGLKFDFPAVFVGTQFSPDLILVADTVYEGEKRLLSKVEGVARALDVAKSTRPLTLIVAGPRPSSTTLESISRVCRVLPAGTVLNDDPEVSLRNWLAVLLPLRLPDAPSTIIESLQQISSLATGLEPEIIGLISMAQQGPHAVQRQLHQIIDDVVADAKEDYMP